AGEIEDCVLVGGRGILDSQGAAAYCVSYVGGESAGEPLIAVLAHMSELHSVRYLFSLPDHLVESNEPSVKSIVAIVFRNGIRVPIELEGAMCDAVRVAADDASKMCSLRYVLLD